MIEYISIIAIPMLILIIVLTGTIEKKDVLSLFADGVIKGLQMMYKIFPHILAIMIGVALFKNTGAMTLVFKPFAFILSKIGVPEEILTLALLRPISGGAANSIVMDIFKEFGPDSAQGKIASILMGGTETTFYVITVLFGAVGVKKIRGTLIAALIADAVAISFSIYIVLAGFV
ncbi:MAG: spore maturation protein [Clostridia bacterium]|nr:spore maturation protein [Clostridia bacterium]MDD4375272.1 spore maturation protein [Clostridia bacterium]